VPEQRLLSPEICRWRRQSCITLSQKSPIHLGFSVLRLFIGEEAALGGGLAGLTMSECVYCVPNWPHPGPPLSHLRSSRSFGKNRRFGFCFIQFREYFLCNFCETQK
jgi:hypothetical protein